jgi:hypothetical protein
MGEEERQPGDPGKKENMDIGEGPWYAGMNSTVEGDSRDLCTLIMSYLGVGPRSRGAEHILSALEGPGDNRDKAICLGEVMEYLADDPSDYYRRLRPRNIDYTSEHGFDHRANDFYEALGIDEAGQMEVVNIVFAISTGILQSIAASGLLTAQKSGLVFEQVLNTYSNTDKKMVAAAIYNFFTAPAPASKPKTFGPPV